MERFKFIWIDDDPERIGVATNLGRRLKVDIEFTSLRKLNVEYVLAKILKKAQPDLVIIDHRLDTAASELIRTGFMSAAFIREKWPACPIICVTGIDKDNFNSQQHSLYQETYEISDISSHDTEILSIAESFKHLRLRKFKDIEMLLSVLKVPDDDKYKLASILPQEIKEHITDKNLAVHLSKWIRKTLFARPGFLYNRLWVSTLIGVKEESFKKVEYLFASSKYEGIFHNKSDQRWWKSEVLDILGTQVSAIGLPWEIGRFLPKIKKSDYSIDYVNNEAYPETVAFVDQTIDSKQYPMRIKYTEPHPNYEDMLFFEKIRMMKGQNDD